MMILATAGKATDILVMMLIVIISVVLIFLLIKGLKNEQIKFLQASNQNLTAGIEDLVKLIKSRIATKTKTAFFSLIEMYVHDIDSLYKVCGEGQVIEAINETLLNIRKMLPVGSRISYAEKDKIWIYLKNKYETSKIDAICNTILFETRKTITLVGALTIDLEVNLAAISFNEGGKDYDTLLSNLELTAISTKRKGKNNYEIFSSVISNVRTEEYNTYKEIQRAIEKNQFTVYYQPIINVTSLEVTAVEAFLRWEHETKGILSPTAFLPTLEHTGDIHWVGIWAFDNIAKQMAYWKQNNPEESFKVHINWSVSQLSSPVLHEEVRKVLKKHKVNHSDFCFEIQDYNTGMHIDALKNNLEIFRQLGIHIAIDNYALEISTLSSLDGSKFNIIKLNKDFIAQIQGSNIMKNVAQMLVLSTSEKQIELIAEGVENIEMIETLRQLKIGSAQGYYFSRPKTATETMADIELTPWKG